MLSTTFLLAVLLLLHAEALKLPVASSLARPSVVLTPALPTLFVYDHCPFCVRVRLALGLKGIKHKIVFLANDDVATPTALVGKKIAPIFEWPEGGINAMPESLDIIALIDKDARFGTPGFFKPMSGRAELKDWQAKAKEVNSLAQRPRYMMSPLLPEFATADGREAFVKNHPIPPYSKDEWKKSLSSTQRWEKYVESFQLSLTKTDEINANLKDLDKLVFSEDHINPDGISLDDIDLWSRLRSLTLVKGVVLPQKLGAYMNNLSVKGDVPLMTSMAC